MRIPISIAGVYFLLATSAFASENLNGEWICSRLENATVQHTLKFVGEKVIHTWPNKRCTIPKDIVIEEHVAFWLDWQGQEFEFNSANGTMIETPWPEDLNPYHTPYSCKRL